MKGLVFAVGPMALSAALIIACAGDGRTVTQTAIPSDVPSCGSAGGQLSVVPLDPSAIMGWVPLGALNPPSHTFPTDHQYIYLKDGGTAVPLYAPSNAAVTGARITHYSTGGALDDYSLDFVPCRELSAEFGHVRTLSPALLSALGAFDQQCSSYSPAPGVNVSTCYTKRVNVKVVAGQVIGSAAGLDLSLFDTRIAPAVYANPSRWIQNPDGVDHFHVVAFSDYFAEPARSTVRGLLGSFDGKTHRTVEPLGGSIATDVAGTAQGTWFNAAQPTYPESPHFTVVSDNVDPARVDVSIGTSQPSLDPGAYSFIPASGATGTTNRHPSTITPGETIYCWEIGYSANDRRGLVLAQLVDASTLKIEARPGPTKTCASEGTLTFTAAAFTYKR